MFRGILVAALLVAAAICSFAQPSLPSSFQSKTIHVSEGVDVFVRFGGTGPAVLLLLGYAENSDSWAPLPRT
jgi:hypothetical protein